MSPRCASAAAWASRWSSRSRLPDIAAAAVAVIEAHARAEAPRECCGLLIGRREAIVEAVAVANTAATPATRYEIAPIDHVREIRRCRQRGDCEVVGAYHSHPRGAPVPSARDLAEAFTHFWFVIAGPVDGSAPFAVRAYELVDGAFAEAPLTIP